MMSLNLKQITVFFTTVATVGFACLVASITCVLLEIPLASSVLLIIGSLLIGFLAFSLPFCLLGRKHAHWSSELEPSSQQPILSPIDPYHVTITV